MNSHTWESQIGDDRKMATKNDIFRWSTKISGTAVAMSSPPGGSADWSGEMRSSKIGVEKVKQRTNAMKRPRTARMIRRRSSSRCSRNVIFSGDNSSRGGGKAWVSAMRTKGGGA